jgi:cobaltochelatase CobN
VIQAICAQDNQPGWRASEQGLGPRDLAMHIALPELDGRIISRPISFKDLAWRSERSQSDVVCYRARRSAWTLSPNWRGAGSSWRGCRMPTNASP